MAVGGSSNLGAGSLLQSASHYRSIRDQASGELPLLDFKHLVAFSGFVPSAGADEVANYLATKARALGLANVSTERFSSNGALYCWAFRHEPYWEGQKGELWLVEPTLDRLADFKAIRTCLARNSRSCSVTAELTDVGSGDDPRDYEGRNVEGKVVLAHGSPFASDATGSLGTEGIGSRVVSNSRSHGLSRPNRTYPARSMGRPGGADSDVCLFSLIPRRQRSTGSASRQ